jgi:hypothetical protein
MGDFCLGGENVGVVKQAWAESEAFIHPDNF